MPARFCWKKRDSGEEPRGLSCPVELSGELLVSPNQVGDKTQENQEAAATDQRQQARFIPRRGDKLLDGKVGEARGASERCKPRVNRMPVPEAQPNRRKRDAGVRYPLDQRDGLRGAFAGFALGAQLHSPPHPSRRGDASLRKIGRVHFAQSLCDQSNLRADGTSGGMRAKFLFPGAAPHGGNHREFLFANWRLRAHLPMPAWMRVRARAAVPPAFAARERAWCECFAPSFPRSWQFHGGSSLPRKPATIARVRAASFFPSRAPRRISRGTARANFPARARWLQPWLPTHSRKPTAAARVFRAATDRAASSSRCGRGSSSCTPDPSREGGCARSDNSFPAPDRPPAWHCSRQRGRGTPRAVAPSFRKTSGSFARPFGRFPRTPPMR